MKSLGKFSEFVKQYEKARRPYPPEVFKFLKSLIKFKNPLILDLGCGTGISTRQLTKIGSVIGCDPDQIMIRYAKKHSMLGIKKYIIARADDLPFPDEAFDVVTAFSAFHWFDDKKSVVEIKRVLKPGGMLFIAGRTGRKSWGQGYRKAIIKTINREVAQFVKSPDYNPKKTFADSGFKNIKIMTKKRSEIYSLASALNYVQSVSIWNSVPKSFRAKAIDGLEEYFKNVLKKYGKIERRLTVKSVAGFK